MRLLILILVLIGHAFDNVATASGVLEIPPVVAQTKGVWAQRFVDNAGVRIEYRVREASGAGVKLAPILFIPGMTGNSDIWVNNHALVSALDVTASRKLIALSLRGRGNRGQIKFYGNRGQIKFYQKDNMRSGRS